MTHFLSQSLHPPPPTRSARLTNTIGCAGLLLFSSSWSAQLYWVVIVDGNLYFRCLDWVSCWLSNFVSAVFCCGKMTHQWLIFESLIFLFLKSTVFRYCCFKTAETYHTEVNISFVSAIFGVTVGENFRFCRSVHFLVSMTEEEEQQTVERVGGSNTEKRNTLSSILWYQIMSSTA